MGPGELLLLTGSPGSGKTTVAPLVADRADPSVCCELDWFFAKLRRGAIEPWLHEAHQQNRTVLRAAAAAMAVWAAGGCFTVAEGIVYPFMVDLFVEACEPMAVPINYAVLRAPLSVAHQRVRDRMSEPEHFGALADETVVENLWNQFEREVRNIDERHRVDIEGLSPAEVADAVFGLVQQGALRL
jgi:broad-specificity NMP kinase